MVNKPLIRPYFLFVEIKLVKLDLPPPPSNTGVVWFIWISCKKCNRYESWAKGPWKGFPLRKPLGMQLTVLAKVLAKVHVHIEFCSVNMCTYCLLCMFHFVYWVIFRESLAKAWRKMAFPRKLGGLNCGLVVSELADEGEQGPTS